MNRLTFISKLKDTLELEENLSGNTNFKELDEWDSMTGMMLMGFVDNEFGVSLNTADLEALTTIDSLIERIGTDKFEE